MVILAIESATPVASAALADEKGLVGECLLNVGLTHAEQLLPLVDNLLQQCRCRPDAVTAVAVSAGPGSFTGLRIGMATAKGLAQGWGVGLVTVPTLAGLAWSVLGQPFLVSPMLNARRNQVYAGLYQWQPRVNPPEVERTLRGKKERLAAGGDQDRWTLACLLPPQAVTPEDWATKLAGVRQEIAIAAATRQETTRPEVSSLGGAAFDGQATFCLLGDGANDYEEAWRRCLGSDILLLPPIQGLARAGYIALAAARKLSQGEKQDLYTAVPLYLRGI